MDTLKIPFTKHIGITRSEEEESLELPFREQIKNHLGTVHAGAQFTLAACSSGEYLQKLLPELIGKVVPVIRHAEVKFQKPARCQIQAFPSVAPDAIETFKSQLNNKGRALISIQVDVKDIEGAVTTTATYQWFIQLIE
ncbi:MAG: YiiD C-terminal domain-containing protein [Pseudomonadota bacterium]